MEQRFVRSLPWGSAPSSSFVESLFGAAWRCESSHVMSPEDLDAGRGSDEEPFGVACRSRRQPTGPQGLEAFASFADAPFGVQRCCGVCGRVLGLGRGLAVCRVGLRTDEALQGRAEGSREGPEVLFGLYLVLRDVARGRPALMALTRRRCAVSRWLASAFFGALERVGSSRSDSSESGRG